MRHRGNTNSEHQSRPSCVGIRVVKLSAVETRKRRLQTERHYNERKQANDLHAKRLEDLLSFAPTAAHRKTLETAIALVRRAAAEEVDLASAVRGIVSPDFYN